MKPFNILTASLVFLLAVSGVRAAEPKVSLKFGKGLTVEDSDSTMSLNISAVMQNRLDVSKVFEDGQKPVTTAQIRRLRLVLRGFAFTPEFEYYLHLGFSPSDIKAGILLDAYMKYSPVSQFSVLFGQTKLPGNREEMSSDSRLQYIDRTTGTGLFKLDRDFGVQLAGNLGNKVKFRPTFSISTGEGRNFTTPQVQNFDYTFRAELLPMGTFKNKGEYAQGGSDREEKPKLAVAVAYDFNNKAGTSRGQNGGDAVPDSVGRRNVHTIFADMIFRYDGLTVAGEYANRMVDDNTNQFTLKPVYTTGQAVWASVAYNFPKDCEPAFRFARVFPGENGTVSETNEYTLGFSKYIKDHSLKIQTDYTFVDNKTTGTLIGVWKLQLQIAI